MNTAISSAYMNCCGMSGTCGIDRNHIDPFNTGRRCVPFRAEKRLFRCTRAHALRWQITPRWGYRNRCCGNALNHIDPFKTGRRCVPFRAKKRLPRCTRAHALRWQITPRWGCRIRNFRGPPTHQLPCRWHHSIELPPCLDRLHRCTCISSLLQRLDIPFLRTVRFDLGCRIRCIQPQRGVICQRSV